MLNVSLGTEETYSLSLTASLNDIPKFSIKLLKEYKTLPEKVEFLRRKPAAAEVEGH